MRIEELAKALPQAFLLGDPDIEIQGISYDSRRVGPGDLFVCIKGYRYDGHSFIRDALLKGAVGWWWKVIELRSFPLWLFR